ncbi:MAG: BamA/TamA family outer membrane protein [Bacteroidetes bacterium]|nr:BamA/TamA family outer membrane protein [Bacteroidota bacterium]
MSCLLQIVAYVVLCSCLSSSPLYAQSPTHYRIRSIACTGNHAISTNRILQTLAIEEDRLYTEQELKRAGARVVNLYSTEGYLDAYIDSLVFDIDTTSQVVDIRYYLSEGKQSIVNSLHVKGDSLFTADELTLTMSTGEGSPFNPTQLENDIQTLLHRCDQKGYPFATLVIEQLERHEHENEYRWNIVLNINKQQRVRLSEVKFEGLKTTREEIAFRETRLQPGQYYTSQVPPVVKKRLERLRVFRSVSTPELYVKGSPEQQPDLNGGLKIAVTEGNTIVFDGMIGYLPALPNQSKGTIVGLLSLQFRNLFGTARSLSTRWYRERAHTQEVEVTYSEPWLLSYPINSTIGITQRRHDSTYIRNSYTGVVEYMVSEEFSVGLVLSGVYTHAIEGYGKRVMPSSSSVSIGASVKYDTRNSVHTPTEGILYSTQYSTGTQWQTAFGTNPSRKNTTQRLHFDCEWYILVAHRQILVLDAHIRALYTSFSTISDLFLFGGTTSLRGYREGQFAGSRIAWLNSEYRYLVAPRSYFFVFSNVGYYFSPRNDAFNMYEQSGYPIGYGVGVRMETTLGFLGVSIAFGKGDTFSTAKLHVRVSNEL